MRVPRGNAVCGSVDLGSRAPWPPSETCVDVLDAWRSSAPKELRLQLLLAQSPQLCVTTTHRSPSAPSAGSVERTLGAWRGGPARVEEGGDRGSKWLARPRVGRSWGFGCGGYSARRRTGRPRVGDILESDRQSSLDSVFYSVRDTEVHLEGKVHVGNTVEKGLQGQTLLPACLGTKLRGRPETSIEPRWGRWLGEVGSVKTCGCSCLCEAPQAGTRMAHRGRAAWKGARLGRTGSGCASGASLRSGGRALRFPRWAGGAPRNPAANPDVFGYIHAVNPQVYSLIFLV